MGLSYPLSIWPAQVAGVGLATYGACAAAQWCAPDFLLGDAAAGHVPTTVDSALGLVFVGSAMVLAAINRPRAAGVCAAVAALIGAVTLAASLSDVAPMWASWLSPLAPSDGEFGGRFGPSPALSLLLSSGALLLSRTCTRHRLAALLMATLAALVVTTAVVSLCGHASGVPATSGWGRMTSMPVPVAAAFVVAGLVLMAQSWSAAGGLSGVLEWPPVPAAVIGVMFSLVVWQALIPGQRRIDPMAIPLSGLGLSLLFGIAVFCAQKAMLYSRRVNALNRELEARIRERTESLQQSQAHYEDLYDFSPDMLVSVDPQTGRITHCNQTAAGGLGYAKDELVGKLEIDLYHPDCRDAAREAFNAFMQRGTLHGIRLQLLRRDGRAVDVSLSMTALRHVDGHILRTRSSWRDISDLVRRERELEHDHRHLQDNVDDATRDLLTANESLRVEIAERRAVEDRLREAVSRLEAHGQTKDQFVSNVSHELRTPLASMSHALENLRAGVLGPLDDRVLAYVAMMEEDSRRLRNTVDDILDMHRIEANRLVLNCRKLHMGSMAEHAAHGLKLQAERRRQRLTLHLEGGGLFVDGDPGKIERVVVNLISNALKFTPEGGHIEVRVRREGGDKPMVVLEVVDDGAGIEPQHLPHIAERYYRVGELVTGTGLGLSLSKDLVQLHGGQLSIQSPPLGRPCGTQVSVRLPAAASPRVLAVDDEQIVQAVIARQLRSFGYEALCAGNGQEALDVLNAEPHPDMVVVDLRIPGMSGFELIARVKAETWSRQIPILVITGQDLDAEQRGILEGFGVGFLVKPWSKAELMERLQQLTLGRLSSV